ncbi:hypothetical protein [Hymenobacter coccineus]|uniref:hypothetical protein n=1 Tax=Hymenobacter coccineus TaxID=1908235 RepID=UPI000AA4D91A|nr:hypothetical protein [Hymenobacter coccineus]
MKIRLPLFFLFFIASALQLRAQIQNQNWYFGSRAAVSFAGTTPTALTGSAMDTYEATASVSSATGNLLFYTNGEMVWNRNNQVMPNGGNLGGDNSSTQGATIVQSPNDPQSYYVFMMPETSRQNLVGGLRYFTVNMAANGGLGDAETVATLYNPAAEKLSERLTAVRHQNGRDVWLIAHNFPGNTFYAFLVSPAGIATVPVASSVGIVQSGGGGNFNANNSVGYLRASADGSRLALAQRTVPPELFSFNKATGQVSGALSLNQNTFGAFYGIEFSPDGSKLYGSTIDGYGITQWNLAAGSAAAIVASAVRITNAAGSFGALATGPDGKIYASVYTSSYLAAIPNPNALGAACGFVGNAVFLQGATCQYGLPNAPSSFPPVRRCSPSPPPPAAPGPRWPSAPP